jgi:O-antigen/teichoic acid export membrane protein
MSEKIGTIAKGAGITAIGLFLSKFLSYLYRIVVAQISPEAYGLLSLGITVVSLGITASLFGLTNGLENYVSKYRAKNQEKHIRGVIYSALYLSLPISIACSLIMFLGAGIISKQVFNNANLIPVLKIFALVPPFAVIARLSLSATLGYQTALYKSVTENIIQNVVQLLATLLLISLSLEVLGAAAGWLIGAIVAAIVALYSLQKFISLRGSKVLQRRKLIRYSYPLFLSGMIGTVIGWSDLMFLGIFLPEKQVGFYNAALPTSLLILIPSQAINSLALPAMSEIVENDQKELAPTMKTLTHWIIALSFPAFILIALFSDNILATLFTPEYTAGALSMIVLAFGHLFHAASGSLDSVLKATSKTQILFKNSVANLVLNAILNIILIPDFGLGLGIAGAAIATTSSTIFVNLLLIAEVYKFEKFLPVHRDIWKSVVSTIPALILTYYGITKLYNPVRLPIMLLGGLVFGLIYLATFIAIGGVREDDKDVIISLGRKIDREEEFRSIIERLT